LVDGEKHAMGYLHEAMDRAKEAIYQYYEDKGEEGFTR
jgi:predicted RNase H-like HicB family nuclease